MGAVLADSLDGVADAGAVDQDAGNAMGRLALRDRGLDLLLAGDVAGDRDPADLARDSLRIRLVEIEHRHPRTLGRHRARGCSAEPGAAAGDQYG